jgi:two-component system alkaline phosphatase synthesis response regulator PhoP
MRQRILLVEDDPSLVSVLTDALTAEGFAVDDTADGSEAVARLITQSFDLVLLDVGLPFHSGFEVCRELRARGIRAPILILTARSDLEDKVLGLKLGADDYVTKPFETTELRARVNALLRRWRNPQWTALSEYRFGSVFVDFMNGNVVRSGVPVSLSAKELQLLRYLISRRGLVLPREELLSVVWGYCAGITRTLDVHIAGLRQKLEETPHLPRYIWTVRGKGYLFRD